jgi:acetyl-CoA acetyltransferase family protein
MVTLVPGTDLTRDETIREGLTTEQLAGLRTVFREDGQVTAGNASSLNDGAAALLLADDTGLRELDMQPLARITASGAHAVDPDVFGIAPVEAVNRALGRAGAGLGDVAVMELNEAFATQALACLSQWPALDPEVVNPLGGAIAIGHPLGASGARLAGSLAFQLATAGSGVGVATLCVGVGQGLALVMER